MEVGLSPVETETLGSEISSVNVCLAEIFTSNYFFKFLLSSSFLYVILLHKAKDFGLFPLGFLHFKSR